MIMVLGPHKKKAEAKAEAARGRAAPRPSAPRTGARQAERGAPPSRPAHEAERAAGARRSRGSARHPPDGDAARRVRPSGRTATRRAARTRRDGAMPKMKTHSGAKKRFRMTGSGKVHARRANKRHLLEHKSSKREASARPATSRSLPTRRQEDQEAARHVSRPPSHPEIVRPAGAHGTGPHKELTRGTREAGGQRPQEAPGRPRAGQRLPRSALAAVPQGQGADAPLDDLRLPRPQGRARATSASCGSSGSTPPPAPNGMTYNRFIQGLQGRPRSRSTARSSPTWRSTTPPRSPRWSRWPDGRPGERRRPERCPTRVRPRPAPRRGLRREEQYALDGPP